MKYINPGDYRFLHNHNGITYANLNDSDKFKKTGIGYTTQTLEDYPVNLPDDATEIWFKTDINVNDETTIAFNSASAIYNVILHVSNVGCSLNVKYKGYNSEEEKWDVLNISREESMNLEGKTVSVLLHIKSSEINDSSILNEADGEVDLRLNNKNIIKIENIAVMNGESIQLQTMSSENATSYFSNIIISTEELLLRENVFMLPIANTVADGWTKTTQNGVDEYSTDSVNKSIVQTIDSEAVRTALGENISITSVVIQAFDLSSNNEEEVDSIQKIVKFNNIEYLVGESLMSSNNYINDSITENPATGEPWALEDLLNTELILRTAKSSV